MSTRVSAANISKDFNIGFKKNQGILSRLTSLLSGREPQKKIVVLDDVSFSCNAGEMVGIIGRNGSGKSTLLRILAGIYPRYRGKFYTKGRVVSLLGLTNTVIGRLTLQDNVTLLAALHGISQKKIKEQFKDIVVFAGLEDFIETKLYQFSSGMLQRLFFSLAIHMNPDVLLLDEVFAVGDEKFRNKSFKKIKEMVRSGVCVILVSHELQLVEKYCGRVLWLKEGKIHRSGSAEEIIEEYRNSV